MREPPLVAALVAFMLICGKSARSARTKEREMRIVGRKRPPRTPGTPSTSLVTVLIALATLLVGLPLVVFLYVVITVDRMLVPGH